MKNKAFIMVTVISLVIMNAAAQERGTVTDPRDKKIYKVVKIGDQWWTAQNMLYGRKGWSYDWKTYGWLYDWENAKKACPPGWRLPSADEWKKMIDSFGKLYNEEGKIPMRKEVSKEELKRLSEVYKATYEALQVGGNSGFDVLYAGQQDPNTFQGVNLSTVRSTYSGEGSLAYFWTSDDDIEKGAFKSIQAKAFFFKTLGKVFGETVKRKGVRLSVRCVYDPELPEIPADTLELPADTIEIELPVDTVDQNEPDLPEAPDITDDISVEIK